MEGKMGVRPSRAAFRSSEPRPSAARGLAEPRNAEADHEVHHADEAEDILRIELAVVDEDRGARELKDAEDRDGGRIDHEVDEPRHEARHDGSQRLRQNQVAQRCHEAQTRGARCLPLPARNGLQAAAYVLADVRPMIEREGDARTEERRELDAEQPRQEKVEPKQEGEGGYAADQDG